MTGDELDQAPDLSAFADDPLLPLLEWLQGRDERREEAWKRSRAALIRRQRTLTYGVVGIAILTLSVVIAGLVAFGGQADRIDRQSSEARAVADAVADVVDRVQETRFSAARDACEARNDQAIDLAAFVSAVAPDLEALARRTFRIQPDCAAFARASVAGRRPPAGVAQRQRR